MSIPSEFFHVQHALYIDPEDKWAEEKKRIDSRDWLPILHALYSSSKLKNSSIPLEELQSEDKRCLVFEEVPQGIYRKQPQLDNHYGYLFDIKKFSKDDARSAAMYFQVLRIYERPRRLGLTNKQVEGIIEKCGVSFDELE